MTALMPGAEPFSAEGGPTGVLVLHGFTGNPQSMRPLAEALAVAGHTVALPLLPGHGTRVADMLPTRREDWSGAAEKAYDELFHVATLDHDAALIEQSAVAFVDRVSGQTGSGQTGSGQTAGDGA